MTESPATPPTLSDVPRERWPRHVAVIMDGNGRWARRRGLPRVRGHIEGARRARAVTEEAARIGLEQLTLYTFSSENWSRPADEIAALLEMYRENLAAERPTIMEHDIRFRTIGRREGLPPEVLAEQERTEALSAGNSGLVVCLAVNYGGRAEMTRAVRRLAARVKGGEVEPEAISEETIAGHLDTAGMRDPDLVIRTAGEMRLSNFLLWQSSYAEFWVSPKFWPDFTESDFHQAIRDFAGRRRRFGRVDRQDET